MPRRNDIHKILLIGSGPIVIGQACEFDYSGTQACKALREEGYEVVLVNSNPATIMTDPGMADRTYIEPLTWEVVARVIEAERPDALLPTLGGQTALNLAIELDERGVLARYGVEMIGARPDVIRKAENREEFKQAMGKIGLEVCRGRTVHNLSEAREVLQMIGLPCVLRPSFTMGGSGSAVAYNRGEFDDMILRGLELSPVTEVLVEELIYGWKEYELEVMRDADDNVVIICSIENFDPLGVHTGDSITVAPAQTLSDKEYQRMRDAALAVIREIGVETGGSNIQFAIDPQDGRMIVIEMNPPRQPLQRPGQQGHRVLGNRGTPTTARLANLSKMTSAYCRPRRFRPAKSTTSRRETPISLKKSNRGWRTAWCSKGSRSTPVASPINWSTTRLNRAPDCAPTSPQCFARATTIPVTSFHRIRQNRAAFRGTAFRCLKVHSFRGMPVHPSLLRPAQSPTPAGQE